MTIEVRHQFMSEHSPYKRRRTCDHTPQCQDNVLIITPDGSLTLCRLDAIEYAQAIFDALGILPELTSKRGWNEEDKMNLIHFMATHEKIEYGMIRELAQKLGKTPIQVKNKMYRIKKEIKGRKRSGLSNISNTRL